MNRINAMYLGFLLLLFTVSCTPKNSYKITGNAVNTTSSELFLEKITQQQRSVIDTVSISSEGDFSLEGPIESAGIFRLRDQQQKGIIMHLKPGDKVTLMLDFDDINNYEVSGSEESQRFKAFNTYYSNRNQEKQDLIAKYRAEQDSTTKAGFLEQLQNWDVNTIEEVKQKIQEEPSALLGVLMIGAIPSKTNKDFYNQFNDRIQLELPNSEYAKEFDELVVQINSVVDPPSIGEMVPEIAMANPEGEVLKLSDLKGKYVLIDFWAAWCRPCRAENPNIVEAYNKYNDQGFEIFSVSLDRTNQAWVAAIEQDNLDWKWHVSDLKFWNNAAAKQYGVKSIPANYLLDPEGKVVGTNLRGPQLQAKLAEIFAK